MSHVSVSNLSSEARRYMQKWDDLMDKDLSFGCLGVLGFFFWKIAECLKNKNVISKYRKGIALSFQV